MAFEQKYIYKRNNQSPPQPDNPSVPALTGSDAGGRARRYIKHVSPYQVSQPDPDNQPNTWLLLGSVATFYKYSSQTIVFAHMRPPIPNPSLLG